MAEKRKKADNPETKSELKKIEENMRMLGIEIPHPIMAEKVSGGVKSVSRIVLDTNVYGIRLPQIPVYRYDIRIVAKTSGGKELELTKQCRDDYMASVRVKKCIKIFNAIREDAKYFFHIEDQILYYDGQKILYSVVKLNVNGNKEEVFSITRSERLAKIDSDFENLVQLDLIVSEVTSDFQFTLNDLSSVSQDLTCCNQILAQFINIATSQYIIHHPDDFISFGAGISYLKDPSKAHFGQEDYPKLNDGKAVYIGVHKSATFVEGPKGKGSKFAAIVVDTAKTAFHIGENILDKVVQILPEWKKNGDLVDPTFFALLCKQLKGLYCETNYKGCKKRIIFRISGVSAKSARTESFEYSGETLTIEQYYHKRYNIQLQYPNAPLLISKKSQNTCLFPMELSYVIEGQRVSQEQQTPKQLISMRTACIIPPAKRKVQNDKNVEAIHLLDNNNQWVARAGIDVIKRPLQVDARILPNPKILYGYGNASQVDPEKWSFGKNRFRRAATITTWAAYEILAIRGNANRRCSSGVREFIQRFIKTASEHGMKINSPNDCCAIAAEPSVIENCFASTAGSYYEFLLFIQDDRCSVHDLIKAMERKYGIVTQDIKKSIASAVINKGKWQTMENIILKTNIKMGGINYIILGDEKPDRLIIGLAMSHPTDGINPSNANGVTTVGYAANTGESQLEFIGDFSFQRAGSTDAIQLIVTFIKRILERYVKQYNCNPSEVLIYRSGISEGQYKMALTMEIPLIRKALQMCGCPELPITYIVVTRLHNIRFMPPKITEEKKIVNQNIRPGVVIDKQVVHPKFKEFYLNAHKTLQGTAKVPRYTVIVDDKNMSMDELEVLTYSLCFCHQIVTLTTSVPTPLYIAGLYADRGRRLMRHGCEFDDRWNISGNSGNTRGPIDLEKLNQEIPYEWSNLKTRRINA